MSDPRGHWNELFENDHAHIMGMLGDVDALCRRHSFFSARKVFGQFRWLLEHHVAQEDLALESLRRDGALPEQLLQRIAASHRQIQQAVDRTWAALCCDDDSGFRPALAELVAIVTAHEKQELEELLPALRSQTKDAALLEQRVRCLIER